MRLAVALSVSFLAVAAASCTQKPADPSAPAIKLYALDCGRFVINDLSIFDSGGAYDGRSDKFADGCFLIRHPKGDLLWDSGLSDQVHDQPEGVTSGTFSMKMPKTLMGQLSLIGVQPSDIEYFSISHSHPDHVGNANAFAGSTFIVQSAERAFMFRDEARAADGFANYSMLEASKTTEINGDYDVFGDGSVEVISTPGHTPGHSSLLVKLKKEGPVLLSGDLYHMAEAREKRTVPVFNTDKEETLRSMDKFEALAKETSARVIIQHEDADMDALPALPHYLE